MSVLEVDVITLSEILVPRGFRVEMGKVNVPGIHYNLAGTGTISIAGGPPLALSPHTLIIVPPNFPIAIEVEGRGRDRAPRLVGAECHVRQPNGVLRVDAGASKPEVIQICGFFNATYGARIGLFRDLAEPIIESFEPSEKIDARLKEAIAELVDQEVGAGAMTAALLKQVIVSLVRRSLGRADVWTQRFSILSDRQIARAFADMSARPGAPHTIHSLTQCAGLSRSTFMARFTEIFGQAPMLALRELRMRQAALQLTSTNASIDQIAFNAGYASRSSFVRAFRGAYDQDPTEYRTTRSEAACDGTA